MSFISRLRNLWRGGDHAAEVDEELAFHLAERADALEAAGLPRAEAEAQARRSFGNRTGMAERTHDVDVLTGLESLLADLRYALRALRLSPGFTMVAVLSLALGIGANTAIFSLIHAVLLRSLPVDRPDQLVTLQLGQGNESFTNPLWERFRDHGSALASSFAYSDGQFDLSEGGPVRRVRGAWVSGGYFQVLGVRPVAGRLLAPADDVRGCPLVAVAGAGLAARELGGVREAVGRRLPVQGHVFTVVGVAEPGFSGVSVGEPAELYLPICAAPVFNGVPDMLDRRSMWWLSIMGRLPEGGSLQAAQARLTAESPALFEATVPLHWGQSDQADYRRNLMSARAAANGSSSLRDGYGRALWVLLGVVGLVLVIACANIANLLLARAAARQREMAIRLAIGAGRSRLVRQLLTESLVLAGLGAAAGALFAQWAAPLLVRLLGSGERAVWLDLSPDPTVLGFTALVAGLTAVLFGLAPAFRATRVDPQASLKAAGRGLAGGARHRLGRALVVGQVALSLVLVVTAGLLGGSFRRLVTLDPGFRREGVLLVRLDADRVTSDEARRRLVFDDMLERFRALPGVTSAAASLITPVGRASWNNFIVVPGYTPAAERDDVAWFNGVSPGFFDTYGTELVAGRDFGPGDGTGTQPVAVVNETFTRRYFGGANPLGRTFQVRGRGDRLEPPITVVGVARDARYQRLNETQFPIAYLPLSQSELWGGSMNFALRAGVDPASLTGPVTAAAVAADSRIGLSFVTLEEQVAASLTRPRLLALLSVFFGGLALLLAVVGLYGTVAYGVAQRRNEIGIRLALGAARTRVVRMIVAEAGLVVLAGAALGLGAAVAATRVLRTFLFGLTPTDPATLAGSALLLAAVALAAGALPAWRASRLDPMSTLREE